MLDFTKLRELKDRIQNSAIQSSGQFNLPLTFQQKTEKLKSFMQAIQGAREKARNYLNSIPKKEPSARGGNDSIKEDKIVKRKKILRIRPFNQTSGYCGPAALKMVLDALGIKKSEEKLAKLSGATRKDGVESEGLIRAAEKLGLVAFQKNNVTIQELKKYVKDKKIPVIVDWFSTDEGHYSVAVNMDATTITLADPELGKFRKMDLEKFEKVWFDFDKNDEVIWNGITVIEPK